MKTCRSYFLADAKQLMSNYAKTTMGRIIAINLVLALVAVFRDISLASYLGTSAEADAFLLAFFLPDTVGNNLMLTAIVAACVPVFSRLHAKGDKQRLAQCSIHITIFFWLLSLAIFLFLFFQQQNVIAFLGKGLSFQTGLLSRDLFLIMLPGILMFSLIAVGSASLQAYEYFYIPSLAPVAFNAVWLAGILAVSLNHIPVAKGVYHLSYYILAAVASMLVLIWLGLFKYRIKIIDGCRILFRKIDRETVIRDLHQVFYIFFPYLLILGCSQSVLFAERYLASHLEVGSIAGLNYAYRLSQFPIWVFVAAVGMVILPSMSKSSGFGNMEEIKATLSNSLWLVLATTLPMSIVLFGLRDPIVTILLQRGAFDLYSLEITTGILAGYAIAIVGQAMTFILIRVSLAIGQMVPIMLIAFFSAAVNIVANYFLVEQVGSAGLGFGAAIGSVISAGVMLMVLKTKLDLSLRKHSAKTFKVLKANLPMIVAVILCSQIWHMIPPESGFLLKIFYVFFVVVLCSVVYLISLRRCKLLEETR